MLSRPLHTVNTIIFGDLSRHISDHIFTHLQAQRLLEAQTPRRPARLTSTSPFSRPSPMLSSRQAQLLPESSSRKEYPTQNRARDGLPGLALRRSREYEGGHDSWHEDRERDRLLLSGPRADFYVFSTALLWPLVVFRRLSRPRSPSSSASPREFLNMVSFPGLPQEPFLPTSHI